MKEAFLNDKLILASQAYDAKATYKCPYCGIDLKLKSFDGKVSPYFGRNRESQKHSFDCPYAISYTNIENSDRVIKESLEDILMGARKSRNVPVKTFSHEHPSKPEYLYVRTPKQLYNFCQSNSCETPYRDNLLVDDILLSRRNIRKYSNGITGLRLVVGTTYRFVKDIEKNIYKFECGIRKPTGFFRFWVFFSTGEEMKPYKDRVFAEQPDNFSGYPIAVLGNWENPEPGLITTHLIRIGNIFFPE